MEKSNVLISVIVPVYNVEPYLRRCVDSILAQTFTNFELILVDDGSPDNCGAICDEYASRDNRITVIHKENGGLSSARNAGIDWAFANSDSEWITFIDSDDWVQPLYLELLFHAVVNSYCLISVCSFIKTKEKTLPNTEATPDFILLNTELFYCKYDNESVIACGKLYNKELFKRIRYPVGKIHEDSFTTYKLLFMNKNIAFIKTPLYCYFINENSITRGKWRIERLAEVDAFAEQVEFFKNNSFSHAYVAALHRLISSCLNCCFCLKTNFPNERRLFSYYKNVLKSSVREYSKKSHLSNEEMAECKKIIHYRRIQTIKYLKRKIRHIKEYIESKGLIK